MNNKKLDNKQAKNNRFRLSGGEKEIIKDIGKFLMALTAAGAALGVLLIAPNLAQMIKPFIKKYPKYKSREDEVEKIFYKISKNRLVNIVTKNNKQHLEITDKGKRQFIEYDIDTIKIKKQKWDGRWRVVIFDIPEEKRIARNILRDKLREIGFIKIQKSVWASPYECENEISFITSVYEVEKFVNYLVVERADFSNSLKAIFKI